MFPEIKQEGDPSVEKSSPIGSTYVETQEEQPPEKGDSTPDSSSKSLDPEKLAG